jgi:flagellar hook assembly protein FlgD
VEMDIYNIAGQKVTTLISAWQTAGNHKIKWNGQDKNGMNVSSGIYLYQLKANGFQQCKKMILIR